MCGIVGVLGEPNAPLSGALDRLAHRGPDGRGEFADRGVHLGHLRLSILDPTERGAQPMTRHRLSMVYNGEIYNFLELRAELVRRGHTFLTETDTEVILAAFEEWGIGATERMRGMWALAVWDSQSKELVLSRDRFGIKPLYYGRSPSGFVFASEPREVANLLDHPPAPDLRAVTDFLVAGLVDHSEHTFFAGVRSVVPGQSLIVERTSERRETYYRPPELSTDASPAADPTADRRDVDDLRESLAEAVRLHLRSDVPIGSCLSGGIDSSAVVCLAAQARIGDAASARQQHPQHAIHARFDDPGLAEWRYAAEAAEAAGAELHYASVAAGSLVERALPTLRAQGEPVLSSSVIAQHAVMSAASDLGLKVMLDGQGSDELMGGYLSYAGIGLAQLTRAHPFQAWRELSESGSRLGGRRVARATVRALLPESLREGIRRRLTGIPVDGELSAQTTLRRARQVRGTPLATALWHDFVSDSLPALLRYEDRNSMAFGIEARVPFVDHVLVDRIVRMPDRLKIRRGETKRVLRDAMAGIVPDSILRRSDKLGFSTPEGRWLIESKDELGDLLGGGQIVQRGWVDSRTVRGYLDAPGRHAGRLWRLFSLEAWLRLQWPAESVGEASTDSWHRALDVTARR